MEFLGQEISIAWQLSFIVLVLAYIYGTWTFDHFRKFGIPGPRPWPLVGNLVSLYQKGFVNFQLYNFKKYGRVFGAFEGRRPMLYTIDAGMLRRIMVKEFPSFYNRRQISEAAAGPLAKGVFRLHDEDWKRVRSQMTPAFSTGKLRQMTTAMNACADLLVRNVGSKTGMKAVDIRLLTNAFSMDVIARCVYGLQVDSQQNPNDPFVKHARGFFAPNLVTLLIATAFPKLSGFLKDAFSVSVFPQSSIDFFSKVVDNTINQRSHDDMKQVDLLSLMIKARELEPDSADIEEDNKVGFKYEATSKGMKGMSKDELMANAVAFFVAGSDTTASTIAYFLYSIATNPDVHARLTKEIDEVIGNQTIITQEMFARLSYLDQVVQETLRMYPLGVRMDRECSADIEIEGITFRKGDTVAIPIYGLHHDPEYWPEPEKFDPDRFLPEVKASRDPLTYIPFGYGPRNCVGMRLAQMEVKIAAVKLLQKFTFKQCPETEVPLTFRKTFLLFPKNPIKLQVESRE